MALWDKDRQKKGTVKIRIDMRDHETTSEEEDDTFTESEEEEEELPATLTP